MGSRTSAMNDFSEAKQQLLASLERCSPYVDEAIGFIVAIGGRIVGAEMLDQPRTARALWSRLIRGYGIDALDSWRGQPTPPEAATTFLQVAQKARCEASASPGLGDDVRIEGNGLTGSALVGQLC